MLWGVVAWGPGFQALGIWDIRVWGLGSGHVGVVCRFGAEGLRHQFKMPSCC